MGSMKSAPFRGWLFDIYPRGGDMVLWFITPEGVPLRVAVAFPMPVYLAGATSVEVERCADRLHQAGEVELVGWTERNDLWTGKPMRVFAMRVLHVETWKQRTLPAIARKFPDLSWFNADLLPAQVWFYENNAFPLAQCAGVIADGRLTEFKILDDVWDRDYPMPPLRQVHLEGRGFLDAKNPRIESLSLTHDGRTYQWRSADGILGGFQRAMDDIDPDVVVTQHGDGFLLPLLLTCAARRDTVLRLDRDPAPGGRKVRTEGRSFFSYGRILFQEPDCELFGRWHLDGGNSFMVSHTGFHGMIEAARVGRYPVQRGSRRSIGTGITSVQLAEAWRRGVLVPWKKAQPEVWKPVPMLLKTDRGGLVYAPRPGIYENVVELDFAAMYPSIMTNFNVSPETINCPCCAHPRRSVPEIGYRICDRPGLVSEALRPVIERRLAFKALRKRAEVEGDEEARQSFDHRQNALKWMLVCSFGYLGYRNARFGRIEAHEAVSAFAREILLRVKDLCLDHGWSVLHGNVDCVWILKPQWERGEIDDLIGKINTATGLTIVLEGIYKWLAFLPSRQVADRPVPTRYYGAFVDGKTKFRGIECRRGDSPAFIATVQEELLTELAAAPTADEYRRRVLAMRSRMEEYEGMLRRCEVPLEQLMITTMLSREPAEYRGNSASALAARQSIKAGLEYHAGQPIRYILTDKANTDPNRRVRLMQLIDPETTADPDAYITLLRRAMNCLLWPSGHQLDETPTKAKPKAKPRETMKQLTLWDAAYSEAV